MTEALHLEDAYLKHCEARVEAVESDCIVLDRTVFYAMGGGQPGDCGVLRCGDREIRISDTRKGEGDAVLHITAGDHGLKAGDEVIAEIDWDRRYKHMRMHTCLHLVGSLIPFGVTGGNISTAKSRLDFDMEDTIDKVELTERLNALIAQDNAVGCRWITEQELDAQPDLVRTLSVQPPRGAGRIRLLEIEDVDLQPCGGTHVRRTAEIGRATISKVEKKGRHNRRVNVILED